MTYFNPICADVGTRNCPCPLAETGDCLVCSRLSGARECSCRWAGVCVYNEYMQNGSMVRTKRQDRSTEILQRLWQGDDLLMLQLRVSRGFALEAAGFFFISETTGSTGDDQRSCFRHGSGCGARKPLGYPQDHFCKDESPCCL